MRRSHILSVCTVSMILAGLFVLALSGPALAGNAGHPQRLCPITGNPIDKTVYLDHAGHRIYFCCDGCKNVFNQDPAKYLSKMKAEGVVLEKTPQGGGTGGQGHMSEHPGMGHGHMGHDH